MSRIQYVRIVAGLETTMFHPEVGTSFGEHWTTAESLFRTAGEYTWRNFNIQPCQVTIVNKSGWFGSPPSVLVMSRILRTYGNPRLENQELRSKAESFCRSQLRMREQGLDFAVIFFKGGDFGIGCLSPGSWLLPYLREIAVHPAASRPKVLRVARSKKPWKRLFRRK